LDFKGLIPLLLLEYVGDIGLVLVGGDVFLVLFLLVGAISLLDFVVVSDGDLDWFCGLL
jgi:hypothetical protein